MSWTDERIDVLKARWTSGATASEIAAELGGVSRNAVIGKAHRLGLESRPSPVKPGEDKSAAATTATAPAPTQTAKRIDPAPEAPAEPASKPVRAKEKSAISTVLEAAAPMPVDGDDADGDDKPAPAPPARPVKAGPTIQYRSVGPGGFIRQGPGDTQPPIPQAPPRRLVPAKPSPEIAAKTGLLELNDRICKWPLGHPGEPDFHFCGQQANPGFPYCVAHCGVAYQAQLPRRDRRPPPPLPFGGPRVR